MNNKCEYICGDNEHKCQGKVKLYKWHSKLDPNFKGECYSCDHGFELMDKYSYIIKEVIVDFCKIP